MIISQPTYFLHGGGDLRLELRHEGGAKDVDALSHAFRVNVLLIIGQIAQNRVANAI